MQSQKKYPLTNHKYESINVPGMFFGGTLAHGKVGHGLTAAVPTDSPYCSCKLTHHRGRGAQLHSLWIVPTAAVS